MDFIYRFRPVSRLLADDRVSGELDSTYIYYADPDQLNDPLEGYKDVYFSGDNILWENLLRHYLRCLVDECIVFLIDGPDVLPNRKVGVFSSRHNSPPAINDLNDNIFQDLLAEPGIVEYISVLGNGRKIRRAELVAHLGQLHILMLTYVFERFYALGLCRSDFGFVVSQRSDRSAAVAKMANALANMGEAAQENIDLIFQASNFFQNESNLLRWLRAGSITDKAAWIYLAIEFPESYVNSLGKLLYPEWYTACFMESCEDSAIWGTYGGNHKDVCLKFKVSPGRTPSLKVELPVGISGKGVIKEWQEMELHKVSYDKDFLEINYFDSFGNLNISQINEWYFSREGIASNRAAPMLIDEEAWRDVYWKSFFHACTVKLKAWDREQEWRSVLFSNINDLSSVGARKIKYDFNSLDGIVFGINTTLEDKFKIISRVKLLCRENNRESFNFYQAKYDLNSKSITHELMHGLINILNI